MAAIDARDTLEAGGERYEIHRLTRARRRVRRRPAALLDEGPAREPAAPQRRRAGHRRRRGRGGAVGRAARPTGGEREISFLPARVLMQDFTGVPAVVDLAAMRHAVAERGADPAELDPLIPADLVIDHSVQVDVFGRPEALARNAELEYERNLERYQFLRWGQQAFGQFSVVPPATGICHQVNLEYLATVVATRDGVAFPDTLVGTDSHTPMVNGLGVVGWGVGGIEAEAALLGQPISMLDAAGGGVQAVGRAARGHDRHRPRPHGHQHAAGQGRGRPLRRVLRPGRGERAAREPGDHRQHVARVRVDDHDLPDRRRDPALPALHGPGRRPRRARRGLRQGTGPVARPRRRARLHRDARPRPRHGRAVDRRAGPPAGPRPAPRGQGPLRGVAARLAPRGRGAGGHIGGDRPRLRRRRRPVVPRQRPARRHQRRPAGR